MADEPPGNFLAYLEEARREFRAGLPGRLARIAALWAAAREAGGAADYSELVREAHSLAGSAGTFGLAAVGEAARALEHALAHLAARPADAQRARAAEGAIGALERACGDPR